MDEESIAGTLKKRRNLGASPRASSASRAYDDEADLDPSKARTPRGGRSYENLPGSGGSNASADERRSRLRDRKAKDVEVKPKDSRKTSPSVVRGTDGEEQESVEREKGKAPPPYGFKADLSTPTSRYNTSGEAPRDVRPKSDEDITPGIPWIKPLGFMILILGGALYAMIIGWGKDQGAQTPQDPSTIIRDGLGNLRAKFLGQNPATWATLNDSLRLEFEKGRKKPTVLLIVANDAAGGKEAAHCLADGISRLMEKVRSLNVRDEAGLSIDFGAGDADAFFAAAVKMKEFEDAAVASVVLRNVQSVRHDQFCLILMSATDPDSAVRKDVGVILVANLDPSQTSSGRWAEESPSRKRRKGLAEFQATLPPEWDAVRKKNEAWRRWAREEARFELETIWKVMRNESGGAGMPPEKIGPVLSRIAGFNVIYVLPEEKLPSECR